MYRKPLAEVVAQKLSDSISFVTLVVGAATLLFLYIRKRRAPQRPPSAPPGVPQRSNAQRGVEVGASFDIVRTKVKDRSFAGLKVSVAWEVFATGVEWKDGADEVLKWFATSCDLYIMCKVQSIDQKQAILDMLKPIPGITRHKILFCSTDKGYPAFSRQISPTLLVTFDPSEAQFLSGVLPYIALVGSTLSKIPPNVSCFGAVKELNNTE